MATTRDNEILTQVGPGTPMGDLMRRYWIPAAMSSELTADGEPMRLVAAPQGCKLDFTPPKTGNAAVGSLSESFFQALNTNANFGQQFAATFTVTCP